MGTGCGILVKRFTGSAWETVGGQIGITGTISSIYVYSGVPYIGIGDSDSVLSDSYNSNACIMKLQGNSWVQVGSNKLCGVDTVAYPIVQVYDSVPYVSFYMGHGGYVKVVKLNGAAWQGLGGDDYLGSASYSGFYDFEMDSGIPYVMLDRYISKYVDGAWETDIFNPSTDERTESHTIDVNNGEINIGYAVFQDTGYTSVIKRNSGAGWETIDTPSCRGIIALASSGNHVLYSLCTLSSNQLRDMQVMKVQPSNDSQIGYIGLGNASLTTGFQAGVLSYTAVADIAATVSMKIAAQDCNATIKISLDGADATFIPSPQTIQLSNTAKKVTITVNSFDGSTQSVYTVNILRASAADASLQSLEVKAGTTQYSLSPVFSPSTLSYTVNVPYTISSIALGATPQNPQAAVMGSGKKTLAYGANKFVVKVTSADKKVAKSYTVTVKRAYPAKPGASALSFVPALTYGFTPGGTNRLEIRTAIKTPVPATVKAMVYNTKGKVVAALSLSNQSSGNKVFKWDGKATAGNQAKLKVGSLVPVSSLGTPYVVKIFAQNPGGSITTAGYTVKLYKNPVISGFTVSPTTFTPNINDPVGKLKIGFKVNHMTNVEIRVVTSNGQLLKAFKLTNVKPNVKQYVSWNGYNGPVPLPTGKWKVQIYAGKTVYKPTTTIRAVR